MNDTNVAARLKARDEAVIREIILKYSKLLWPIAWAVLQNTGTEQDVEECIADVFIGLWQQPERFDPSRGTLKSWLCMVTRCTAIDRYRALSRRRTVPLDGAMMAGRMGLQDALIQEETRQELTRAVHSLEEVEREILIRRYYHEQKPRQIATALGLSVKQVENHLFRSKRKLRKAISRCEGGPL